MLSTAAAKLASAATPPPLVQVVSFAPDASDGHIEYSIKFCGRVTGQRRFREFADLKSRLKSSQQGSNHSSLPPLPSKFFSTSPGERLPLLDEFLVLVCDQFAHKPCPPLADFLRVGEGAFLTAAASRAAVKGNSSTFAVTIGSSTVPAKFAAQIARVKKEVLAVADATAASADAKQQKWKQVGQKNNWEWFSSKNDQPVAAPAKVKAKAVAAVVDTEEKKDDDEDHQPLDQGPIPMRLVMGQLKHCPPRLAHELLTDDANTQVLEPNIAKMQLLEQVDEHTAVYYFAMKSVMMQAARDVIMVRHWSVERDGTVVHAEFSLDDFPGAPTRGSNGLVRASMTCGGTVIRPGEGKDGEVDNASCRIWRVSNLDPQLGDSVPQWALSRVNDYTATMLSSNMFVLEKLVQQAGKKGSGSGGSVTLQDALSRGPMVNANGKVEGGSALQLDRNGGGGAVKEFDVVLVQSRFARWSGVMSELLVLGFIVAFAAALLIVSVQGKKFSALIGAAAW